MKFAKLPRKEHQILISASSLSLSQKKVQISFWSLIILIEFVRHEMEINLEKAADAIDE